MNLFAIRTLQARSWLGVGLSVVLLALAAWLGVQDFTAGAWLSFAAGAVGLVREMVSLARAVRAPSTVVVRRQTEFTDDLVRNTIPSPEEARDGFTVVPVPHLSGQAVVRSPRVDSWLRAAPVAMEYSELKRKEVDARLRVHGQQLETLLRCDARRSSRSVPRRMLVNEQKLGLSDGVSPSRPAVRVHQVSYFHSLLTNEAATRCMESVEEDPEVTFSGRASFFPVADYSSGSWPLLPLAESRMADHIGVSTLVVTRDRKLVFWNQGDGVQQSRNQFASTGSGSCDWDDRVEGDLKASVVRAMEREFREESFGGELPPEFKCETRVLGYFRWLARAGKPEFTGVTYVPLESHRLRPNVVEVNRRRRAELTRDVPTLDDLTAVLDELAASPYASVPFWVNVVTLREAINEARDDWGAFLGLPS